MTPDFDDNQLRAIEARRNAVVTAGAGSGKTAVLAERFLWLLASRGAGVEQILALTFTQKAAAEMYERIYERLRELASTQPAAGIAGPPGSASLRDALEGFERSQISTLDSFCAEIVRGSSSGFGLPGDFRYDEQAVLGLARDTSLDFLLENLSDPAIDALLRVHGFETLWLDLLTDLAYRHFHFAPRLDLVAMVEDQLARCGEDLRACLDPLEENARRLLSIAPRVATLRNNQEALRPLLGLADLARQERFAEAHALLAALSLRKSGKRSSPDLAEMDGLIDRIRPLVEDARPLAHTLEHRTLLRQIHALLERFQDRFVEAKRLQGLVSFQDIAELAVEILVRDRALRQFYKERFRHILIDEFQDNNSLQRDLLFLLAERLDRSETAIPSAGDLEEDKLFFVGDEKQSIYRFRGADVSVFVSLHREIEQAGGCLLELDRNYRSDPGLVSFFNRLFERVLAPGPADQAPVPADRAPGAGEASLQEPRPFEARFRPMRPGRENGSTAQVHVWVRPPSEEEGEELAGDREAEAHAVARFVHRAVEGGELIVGKPGERRPAGYGDFAVLLRSTGNQIHFERELRSLAVPYTSQNLRSLFLEAPFNDFYLLLQLATYPEDRTAYAGFLRSPFVNLSDHTLLRLLLETGGPGQQGERGAAAWPGPVFELPGGDPGEQEKLRRGEEVYRFASEHADLLPLAELVHQLWHRFGYRHLILSDPRYHPYLEFYDFLLATAEAADRRGDSLVRFLDFLRGNLGRYERLEELEALPSRAGGVQLLTIHRSKGLEFPVVVLADMGNSGRTGSSARPYYRSDEFGITVNLGAESYFARLGEAESKQQEEAEIKRLLYVACTRAMNHLVLTGCLGRRTQRPSRAHLSLLLQALELPETPFVPPVDRDGYRLEIHRIEDLCRSRGSGAGPDRARDPGPRAVDPEAANPRAPRPRGPRPPGPRPRGLPLSRMRLLYDREPLERTAPRREISVTELCGRLPSAEPDQDGEGEELPRLPVDAALGAGHLENAFGTLTHELLAAELRSAGRPAPQPEWSRLRIPAELRPACLRSAEELVARFFDSELGRTARSAGTVETELPFVYRWERDGDPLYISGQIDAVLHSAGDLILIDFKTDRVYRPGEHACQLAFYALALQELTGREAQAHLFLLRAARAVPLTRRFDWPTLLGGLQM